MGGGAWLFLVGGVICLVNSDNERDLSLLISDANDYIRKERVFIKALGLKQMIKPPQEKLMLDF